MLAIELAYYLPFRDFKQIFDGVKTELAYHEDVRFSREDEIWIVSLFIHNATDWGNNIKYYNHWRDITPKNFK